MPYNIRLNPEFSKYDAGDYSYLDIPYDPSYTPSYIVDMVFSIGDLASLLDDSELYSFGDTTDGDFIFIDSNGDIRVERYVSTTQYVSSLATTITENKKFYKLTATFEFDQISLTVDGVSSTPTATADKALELGLDLFVGGTASTFIPDLHIDRFRITKVLDEDITTFLENPGGWDKIIYNVETDSLSIDSSSTVSLPLNIGPNIQFLEFSGRNSVFIPRLEKGLTNSLYRPQSDSNPDLSTLDWNLYIMFSMRVTNTATADYKVFSTHGPNGYIKLLFNGDGSNNYVRLEGKTDGTTVTDNGRIINPYERYLFKMKKMGTEIAIFIDGIDMPIPNSEAYIDMSGPGIADDLRSIYIGGDPGIDNEVKGLLIYGIALEYGV
jgi:hypothetical protein